jgi:hypothetical protein
MREQEMGAALRSLLPCRRCGRVSGEEGINENNGIAGLDAEGRMAMIGDFHP